MFSIIEFVCLSNEQYKPCKSFFILFLMWPWRNARNCQFSLNYCAGLRFWHMYICYPFSRSYMLVWVPWDWFFFNLYSLFFYIPVSYLKFFCESMYLNSQFSKREHCYKIWLTTTHRFQICFGFVTFPLKATVSPRLVSPLAESL